MIKFKDLMVEDYSSVLSDSDNSLVHTWFERWILKSVSEFPNMDVSQKSFQWYINKYVSKEENPEGLTAYEILKKFKETKDYVITKNIKVVAPKKDKKENTDSKSVEEGSSTEVESVEPEDSVIEEDIEEVPQILTNTSPQMMKKWIDVLSQEKERQEKERQKLEEEMLDERKRSLKTKINIAIAVCLIGAVICAFVLFIK